MKYDQIKNMEDFCNGIEEATCGKDCLKRLEHWFPTCV